VQLQLAPERLDQRRERALVASLGPLELDGHCINDTRCVGNGPRSGSWHRGVFDDMHPELRYLIVRDKMAGFERDARRYRRGREASTRPRQLVRTAIQLLLSVCRDELERLAQLSLRTTANRR
jgi:hypothetical protein